MPTLPRQFWWLAFHVDARFDLLARRVRRAVGMARPLRILPYRGYGGSERVCIRGRVLEERNVPPPAERRTLVKSAVTSYRRYATVEIPDAKLVVRWGDRCWEARSDEEGFVHLWVEPPLEAREEPGVHRVTLSLVEPDDVTPLPEVEAPVEIVGRAARFGVISDIDDTVIVTGVENLLRRAHALFLTEASLRLPFEGVSAFYAALREGISREDDNPIFYVSSSPWNLHEHLAEFMRLHGIPAGPILLRDWGLTRHGFAPGGGHGHKLAKIREVLDTFPDLRFILIGDSGQEDPEHYRTIVGEQGDRILAVYIRAVHTGQGRRRELEQVAEDIRRAGSEMVVVADTVAAARHAAGRGWINPLEIEHVEHEKEREEREGT